MKGKTTRLDATTPTVSRATNSTQVSPSKPRSAVANRGRGAPALTTTVTKAAFTSAANQTGSATPAWAPAALAAAASCATARVDTQGGIKAAAVATRTTTNAVRIAP